MKRYRPVISALCTSAGMLALILDSKTALYGAAEGIELCIKTVIPALFPFFVLSTLLTGIISGTRLPILSFIGKLCGIPEGAESILLTGLLGGYPVGAQCVSQAYAAGRLTQDDARRMLGFCSNAGPAFLFGMSSILFEKRAIPFILWMIHILSAIAAGAILPHKSSNQFRASSNIQKQSGQALQLALRNMGIVCGWVLLFRIIFRFADRWFLWLLPDQTVIFLTGLLELTNGYMDLIRLPNESLRFIFASIFLAFGGSCVCLQTASITNQAGLDLGSYFPGKLLQTFFSAILSGLLSLFLFPGKPAIKPYWLLMVGICVTSLPILLKNRKNCSSNLSVSGV